MTPLNQDDIQSIFDGLLHQIRQARQQVYAQANTVLIDLHWLIGKTISHQVRAEAWGKGVVTELPTTLLKMPRKRRF